MHVTQPSRGRDEVARLGAGVFDRRVQPALRPEDHGKFVAIDVDTGDYEIDQDDYTAVMRLRGRNPQGVFWLMRAGYRTACRVGRGR